MFVRGDSVKPTPHPAYSGSCRVISRYEKYFVIDRAGNMDTVSNEQLKVALPNQNYKTSDYFT